jgi:hypothetical protein
MAVANELLEVSMQTFILEIINIPTTVIFMLIINKHDSGVELRDFN